MDHYRVLNVSRSASIKEIRTAYLKLAKKLHPDVTGNDKSKMERFKQVSEAHDVLSDESQRREYDASLHGGSASGGNGYHHHHQGDDGPTGDMRYGRSQGFQGYGGGGPRRRADGSFYGIDEEEWYGHHYGGNRYWNERKYRAMHIVEARIERENDRVKSRMRHYGLHANAAYFIRQEARMMRRAEQEAKRGPKEEPEAEGFANQCTIS